MKPRHPLALRPAPAALAAAFALTLALAAAHAGPAAADPGSPRFSLTTPSGTGGPTLGGDVLLSMPRANQGEPAVAYNSHDHELLVVWTDDRDQVVTGLNIYGQRFTVSGAPIGEPFFITNAAGDQQRPDVAYSPGYEYMVVWEDCRNGPDDCDIYGRLVTGGGALLGPGDIAISAAAADQREPAIAAANHSFNYLVVWQDLRNDSQGWDIYGQVVGFGGNLVGANKGIIGGFEGQTNPDVVFNDTEDEFIIVAEDWTNSSRTDLLAMRMDDDGNLLSSQTTLVGALENGDLNLDPAVIWNATENRYLLAYQYTPHLATPLLTDIRAQIVYPDLSMHDSLCHIASAVGNQFHPEAAHNTVSNEYLITWQEGRFRGATGWDIYGKRVDANCISVGSGEFPISRAADDQVLPVLAFGPPQEQYAVFWADGRTGQFGHIYGQRISRAGMPVGHAFGAVSAPGIQEDPAVVYNSVEQEYLAVWADERGASPDIYGQRYDHEGRLLGDNFIVYQADGEQIRPAVAYNSLDNSYLVVWEDPAAGGSIMGRMMAPQGNPLAAPFPVSAGVARQHWWPAVAYNSNPAHNNFMVVYQCAAVLEPPEDYRGDLCLRLVSAGGIPAADEVHVSRVGDDLRPAIVYNPADNLYLIAHTVTSLSTSSVAKVLAERWSALGAPIASTGVEVSNHGVLASAPDVAYNPEDNQYAVFWTEHISVGSVLRGRIVGADESLLGNVFMASSDNSLTDDSVSAGIYFSELDRYRLVWDDPRIPETGWDIWGRWVEAGGTVMGTSDLSIFRYAGWQRSPDIALDPADGEAFTLWQDGRNGLAGDVYGRLGALDHTPPAAAFTVGPAVGVIEGPFTFDASASRDDLTPPGALAVCWDFGGDGVCDTEFDQQKTITHTYAAAGVYTVTLKVRDWAAQIGTVAHRVGVLPPSAAGAAAAATPPTAVLTVDPGYAQAGATFTADARGSTGSGSLRVRWDWENDGVFETEFSPDLTATHIFTVADDAVIRAEVKDETGLTDAALRGVTVLPGAPVSLQVRAAAVRLVPGQSVRFRAAAWDAYGNRLWNPEVTWSLSGAAGTLDQAGWFTAGPKPGAYPNAVAADIGELTARASLRIFWPEACYLPLVAR